VRAHPEPDDAVLTTAIRTISGTQFFHAEGGGGSELSARGPYPPQEGETFDVLAADRAARGFPDGAKVHIRTDSWHYLQAVNGGGSRVNATGPWPREWETFTLVVPGSRPWLTNGTRFGLRAFNGEYVEAQSGGGGPVVATASTLTRAATFTASCEPQIRDVPVRSLTGSAAREDTTTNTVFDELRPTPGQVFTTTQPCTITGLLVTEARVSTPGAVLEARIMVDDQVAHPGVAVLASQTSYETATHAAFLSGIQPGEHTVTVHWRVTAGRGYVRNRSFTVQEHH
jgi:hypothetical protein